MPLSAVHSRSLFGVYRLIMAARDASIAPPLTGAGAGAGEGTGVGGSSESEHKVAATTTAARPSSSFHSRWRGRLANKIAVVTGGGQGIGAAIVRRFVEEGCSHVAVFDVDEAASAIVVEGATALAKTVCEQLHARGVKDAVPTNVAFFHTNMSSEADVATSVASVVEWADGVDILVNNAATFIFGEVQDVTGESWDQVGMLCSLAGV